MFFVELTPIDLTEWTYSTCMSATSRSVQTQGNSKMMRNSLVCCLFIHSHFTWYLICSEEITFTHTINYLTLKKKNRLQWLFSENIFWKHSFHSMKTMNIHPFDNNHTSTTFSAVTKIIWTFIVIYFSPSKTLTTDWITIMIIFPGQEQPQHLKISTAARLQKCQH